jgi:flagellar biogenesis protein FliO
MLADQTFEVVRKPLNACSFVGFFQVLLLVGDAGWGIKAFLHAPLPSERSAKMVSIVSRRLVAYSTLSRLFSHL